MKKNILFLFALFALIISCDDIETNDPAFQALIENYLYRSNDARAEIKADGSLVIQGLTEFEQLSITLNKALSILDTTVYNRGINIVLVDSPEELQDLTGFYVRGGFACVGHD